MKAKLLALLTGIALASLQDAAVAQTLMNPSGFRGVPTVPGPVGGLTGPISEAPTVEPMKINLTPTLPSVPTPTVNKPIGSQDTEPDAPKLPVPPTPPPEPEPDGDAENPDLSGTSPTLGLSMPSGGQGGEEVTMPSTSPEPQNGSSRWIWITVGVLAFFGPTDFSRSSWRDNTAGRQPARDALNLQHRQPPHHHYGPSA